MSSELWSWTASELASAIAAGKITSVEATESALARLEAVNPALNAVVDPLPEQAMAAAKAADAALRTSGPSGPLHGVPVTVKINVDYEGRATTNGVVKFKDLIAPADGSVVRGIRAAGGVILGRTNTPCFSMRAFTSNDLHGMTVNPHDPAITPGGSSGGAGSAVAAGIGAMGHGNDIGGSVRGPAYHCGVYGLRPTAGIAGAYSPSQLAERMIVSQMSSVQGPLARSVEDVRLAMLAMATPDPRDIWQTPSMGMFAPLEHAPCKVAMAAESPDFPTDPEVSAAIRKAGAILADAGYEVVELPTPSFQEAVEYWRLVLGNEMRAGLAGLMEEIGDAKMKKALEVTLRGVPDVSDRDGMLKLIAKRSTLLREWQGFLADYPLILTATCWSKPFEEDFDQRDDLDADAFFAAMAPLTGTPTLGLPGFSIPVDTVPGKPMGVQLIAARYGDRALLNAGAVIERGIGPIAPVDPRG